MTIDAAEIAAFFARSTLGAPDRAVGFMLWRVMHRYQREVDRALAAHGLTHLQFTTLAMTGWLCGQGEAATQGELARRADMHKMQVSLMLRTLEEKKLVKRLRSAADPRAKQVAVTEAGMAALAASMPVVIAIQHRLFGEDGLPGGGLLSALQNAEAAP